MKNIYLIPTNQPSNLVFEKLSNRFYTNSRRKSNTNNLQNQNIYITSDEGIKERDWMYYKHFGEDIICKYDTLGGQNTNVNEHKDYYKKIILTTDQDLINDDVQAIDDEFIEWFVKNSSCEKVEIAELKCTGQCWKFIESDYEETCLSGCEKLDYKIIIPKEPKLINNCPKCGLDLIIREHYTPICTDIDCRGIILSNETLREWASKKEPKQEYEYIGECNGNNGNGCFMDSCGHDCGCFVRKPKKWNQEQNKNKYTKKYIIDLIQFLSMNEQFNGYSSVSRETAKYFFKQFKKK